MGLDLTEMIMALEMRFGIEISDADAAQLRTVGELYDHVRDRVAPAAEAAEAATGAGPYAGELWERYLDVIEKETGRERHRLRPEARFVTDLGLG